jgi:6-phosphogluconolactonase
VAEIETLPAQAAVDRAAQVIAERLRARIADKGHATLAIPGGSALAPLTGIREAMADSWSRVRLTWVDERCVDFWSPDSNRGEAYRSGALDAAQPPGVELPLWLDGDTSDKAIERVQRALVEKFDGALDVALLGMGPDGHIASLFPGHALLREPDSASVQTLLDSPKPPTQRMTLSLGFLQKTRHSYLVALGQSKRDALVRVVQNDPELPLSHLSNLTILTDIDLGATS